jgi:hypothetical protein
MQSKSILYSSTELERKGFFKRSGGKKTSFSCCWKWRIFLTKHNCKSFSTQNPFLGLILSDFWASREINKKKTSCKKFWAKKRHLVGLGTFFAPFKVYFPDVNWKKFAFVHIVVADWWKSFAALLASNKK